MRFTDKEVHVYGFTIPYGLGYLIHDIITAYESIDEAHELAFFDAVSYLLTMADYFSKVTRSELTMPKPQYKFLSNEAVHLVWFREGRTLDIEFHPDEVPMFTCVSSDGVTVSGQALRDSESIEQLVTYVEKGF